MEQQSIRDVMTPNPCAISPTASVLEAAQIMRGNDIGDVIVLIYNFLGGELRVRFVLKALTIGAIAGPVFGYYVWDLRRDEEEVGSPS